jgi:hypothetical protein
MANAVLGFDLETSQLSRRVHTRREGAIRLEVAIEAGLLNPVA